MAQIGILHGNKESFPQAVLEGLNSHRKDCCRLLCVDALNQQDMTAGGWDTPIIFDLFSGQMPFLGEALHLLALDPDRVILNDPLLWRIHNRATMRRIAGLVGHKTRPALLLPAKDTLPDFPEHGYINLRYPLGWPDIFQGAGPYPRLQALRFDRQNSVTVEDLGTLWRRYNETGTELQELVGSPTSDQIYRVYVIGATRFVREVEPITGQLLPSEKLKSDLQERLISAADAMLAHARWSIATFEFGISGDTVEYLDCNPDPYLEWWTLGETDFSQATDGAVAMLEPYLATVKKAPKAKAKSRKKKGNG